TERVGRREQEPFERMSGAPRRDAESGRVLRRLLQVRELALRVLRDRGEDRVATHPLGDDDPARDERLRVEEQRERLRRLHVMPQLVEPRADGLRPVITAGNLCERTCALDDVLRVQRLPDARQRVAWMHLYDDTAGAGP